MSREKQHTILKKGLFLIIIVLLFIPAIQKQVKFIDVAVLDGSFTPKEKVKISLKGWLEGEYQQQKEAYINEKFGFRNLCVRLNNQIAYTFFNYAKANGVTIGKDNYLYEENYIKAYYGEDFVGEEKIITQVNKIKKVQDSLKAKGIDLVIVFAPGKGSFYPEYFPPSQKKKATTNYKVYSKAFLTKGVNFLDFKHWFEQMKDTVSFPLFPKGGTHWSKYGELLAADSIIKYIQQIKNVQTPQIQITNIQLSDSMRSTDDDIEKGMNLLFDIPDLMMAYPSFKKVVDSNTVAQKVLTIADSYYCGMYRFGLSKDYFKNGQFWFYNKKVYPQSETIQITVDKLNFKEEIEKNDVILIMSTDANLSKFPFGVIDRLYDVYVLGDVNALSKKEKRTLYFIRFIKDSKELMEAMSIQVKQNKQSLKKEIRANAEYMVWREENNLSITLFVRDLLKSQPQ